MKSIYKAILVCQLAILKIKEFLLFPFFKKYKTDLMPLLNVQILHFRLSVKCLIISPLASWFELCRRHEIIMRALLLLEITFAVNEQRH